MNRTSIRWRVTRGFTEWGDEVPMKFRMWRSCGSLSNQFRVTTWLGFNVSFRGVWWQLEFVTEGVQRA